ncbi:MAG: DoxX family protein [Candidatus Arcticimaribacter sp.]|nr:MAG: DoxX family protein [Candidatus Arcticimaribacter sp.]PTM00495.1 MAG: DoxX family protein [Candidatus Arcticimaribacter sp.]
MKNYLSLALRIIVAVILLQTLRFKFLAHPDSVYIFTQVGMEPWGRIGIGVLELIASILLFLPKKIWMGAGLASGLMAGAVMMHLTMIGIEVKGDGGALFYTAIATLILSLMILWGKKKDIPFLNL